MRNNKKIHNKDKIGIQCIICNEFTELTDDEYEELVYGNTRIYKVCDKCREAVMKIRNEQSSIDKEYTELFEKFVNAADKTKLI